LGRAIALAKPLCKEKTQHLHKHHRNVGFHSSTQPTEKRFVLLKKNVKIMKTVDSNPAPDDEDDLAAEYTFDYNKAKTNRFVALDSNSTMTTVVLNEDIAQVRGNTEKR
jgi:hypothetical protein